MSEERGPARGPDSGDYTQSIVVAIGGWRLACVVDPDPATGTMRDLAATVADLTGCPPADALAAVLEGLAALSAPTLEDAA